MSTPGGKVLAISIGVLGGGGLGFYYKEKYWARRKEREREKLEEELSGLIKERKTKEKMVEQMINDQ